MNYFFVRLLGLLPGFLFACHQPSSGPPALAHQQYTYTGSSRCDTSSNTGVDVAVSYFLLKDESEGARKINDSLRSMAVSSIVNWLDSTTIATNPNLRTDLPRTANLFAADYESMRKDMGNLGGCWELKTRADTLFVGPKALTVELESYAYTGGAHPNSNLMYCTFDRETGRVLNLTDMVTDTISLVGIVEKAFRAQQELSSNTNLEEQGYFLRDGHFFLPANVGMSRDGLVFYYNPYEIAAYVVGPIQVTVPYTQLGDILRKELLD
ncbi:DUF3298 and DUF4163 domain-containing protein [Spirosoma sp. KNUC1025]|uniref:DUF3298 and DUF4163 domain-containing protein n=1 Tax=Spirosoma sp. KNUC1025 TaxID=2894082 RepID=UPI00386E5654|nr:DUF3298 and DUF4163 domain-containing protein [Spirosoma sp. KNUC1025]